MEIRVLVIMLFCFFSKEMQAQQSYRPPRILFLLDGSSSMLQKVDSNTTKFELAKRLILKTVDSVYKYNSEAEFALRIYGHQSLVKEKNCYDSKLEVAFSKANLAQIDLRLSDIKPKGLPCFEYALQEALNNVKKGSRYNYLLFTITGGDIHCDTFHADTYYDLLTEQCSCAPQLISISRLPASINVPEPTLVTDVSQLEKINADFITDCKQVLKPRNNAYKSEYGSQRERIHTVVPNRKTQLPKKEYATAMYGYLKINKNLSNNNLSLYYRDSVTFEYILLKQLNITALVNGQNLKLQTGKYRLAYEILEGGRIQKNARFFNIEAEMVTEISLL